MLKEQTVSYTEHIVQRGSFHISAREYPGEEPTIVLMHGFPDTSASLRPSPSLALSPTPGRDV